jgi:hypothetical protein
MAFPSRVLGAGTSGGTTTAICGDVANTLTAAGSTAADALSVDKVFNRVTTAALNTGIKIPNAEAGALIVVINDGANPVKVYPQTGSTIDGSSSATVTNAKRTIFVGISPTAWYSIPSA